MSKARLVFHRKEILERGLIIEMKVWEVPRSKHYPDGFRYSLFAVKARKVLIGYDNHRPKGHHKHVGTEGRIYIFRGIDTLISDFTRDVEKLTREEE